MRAYYTRPEVMARLFETNMLYDRMTRGTSHVEGRAYTYTIRTSRK